MKLVRSKGVGVYFVTQNPRDIPDNVLAQLGNKVQHALHAYTPAEQKAVRAAAQAFRENPAFKTYDAILELGTGEAIVSFLNEGGIPSTAQRVSILPPQSRMGSITDSEREDIVMGSILYSKYAVSEDPDSAYEFLLRREIELEKQAQAELEAKEKEKADALAAKEKEKAEAAAAREKAKADAAAAKAAKQVGSTVAGTVGREVGKTFGGKFGTFGKTLGGNLGASLGRGLLNTLFNRKS